MVYRRKLIIAEFCTPAACKALCFAFLMAALALPLQSSVQAMDHISIKFTRKNQLRTSFRWIENQPRLIRNKFLEPVAVEEDYQLASGVDQRHQRPEKVGVPEVFYDLHLPYGAVGKIFFIKRDGEISTCTGAFAGTGNTVLTAAHCVLSLRGDWHRDFIFVLAYGTESQEVYGIECAAVPGEWGYLEGRAALDFDYAFLRTTRPSSQGSLGITNGLPPDRLMLVGYSNNFNNGRSPIRVSVETFADGPARLGYANNPLSFGSSGTPWVGMSTVYSLTSHFHQEYEDVMLGPRFTEKSMDLLNYVRNGCQSG